MNRNNCVIFKKNNAGICILFDEKVDFEILKEQFIQKIEETSKFFEGVKTPITFKGKALTEEQEVELLRIISDNTTIDISFVTSENSNSSVLSEFLTEKMKGLNMTKYHKGSLRSGQVITFGGSVVVVGDVNPGAIIRAEGNIIVLGHLKGLAHAGYKGNMKTFVAAMYMAPIQLRIADIITYFPEQKKKGKKMPEYACIEDGQIYVISLT